MEKKSSNTTSEYLKTKIMTASPEELQLMLYDGAIRFCEQAREAIQAKQIENSYNLLSKAENVLLELASSMRDEIAPETCEKMRALYMFCYDRLVTANLKRQVLPVDEALKVLRHIRETWTMLMEKLKEEKGIKHVDQQNTSIDQSTKQSDKQNILQNNDSGTPVNMPSADELAEIMIGSTISVEG